MCIVVARRPSSCEKEKPAGRSAAGGEREDIGDRNAWTVKHPGRRARKGGALGGHERKWSGGAARRQWHVPVSVGCWRYGVHVRGPSYTRTPPGDRHSAGLTQSAPHVAGSLFSPPACTHPTPHPPSLRTMWPIGHVRLQPSCSSCSELRDAAGSMQAGGWRISHQRSGRAVGVALASDPGGRSPPLSPPIQEGGWRSHRRRRLRSSSRRHWQPRQLQQGHDPPGPPVSRDRGQLGQGLRGWRRG